MEIVLLYNLYMGTHLYDLRIDRLIVEVLYAFLIYGGLTSLGRACDHTAVLKRCIIGLCRTSAEGLCKEILCKIKILAVGCDVKRRTTV